MQSTHSDQQSSRSLKQSYCFNPDCSNPFERIFNLTQRTALHVDCNRWIINQEQLYLFQAIQPNDITIDKRQALKFRDAPLAEILSYQNKKKQIVHILNQFIDRTKDEVCALLNHTKATILDKLEVNFGQIESISSELVTIMLTDQNKRSSFEIDNFTTRFRMELMKLKNMQVYDNQKLSKLKNTIKKAIEDIGDSIVREEDVEGEYEFVSLKDLSDMKDYYSNITVNQLKIIQVGLGWEEKMFVKENKEHFGTKIICLFCKNEFLFKESAMQIKSTSNPILNNFILHLISNHQQALALEYSYRISRSKIYWMSFSDILYTMQRHNYQQLVLYDGSITKPMGREEERNVNELSVEFVSETRNLDSIDRKYSFIKNQEDAAYLIIILIYEVCGRLGKKLKIKNFKKYYYPLLTKIVENLKLKSFVDLEEKKNLK